MFSKLREKLRQRLRTRGHDPRQGQGHAAPDDGPQLHDNQQPGVRADYQDDEHIYHSIDDAQMVHLPDILHGCPRDISKPKRHSDRHQENCATRASPTRRRRREQDSRGVRDVSTQHRYQRDSAGDVSNNKRGYRRGKVARAGSYGNCIQGNTRNPGTATEALATGSNHCRRALPLTPNHVADAFCRHLKEKSESRNQPRSHSKSRVSTDYGHDRLGASGVTAVTEAKGFSHACVGQRCTEEVFGSRSVQKSPDVRQRAAADSSTSKTTCSRGTLVCAEALELQLSVQRINDSEKKALTSGNGKTVDSGYSSAASSEPGNFCDPSGALQISANEKKLATRNHVSVQASADELKRCPKPATKDTVRRKINTPSAYKCSSHKTCSQLTRSETSKMGVRGYEKCTRTSGRGYRHTLNSSDADQLRESEGKQTTHLHFIDNKTAAGSFEKSTFYDNGCTSVRSRNTRVTHLVQQAKTNEAIHVREMLLEETVELYGGAFGSENLCCPYRGCSQTKPYSVYSENQVLRDLMMMNFDSMM
ncbi:hypothetical protein BaRGS_00013312 [Batillaria attramentaria]|uniref:Uncharacterized protein n=1 Tax=Batillaria attramentaria TaxID=370345 RepID=A0ABD0L7U9_9CAEN